MMLVAGVHGLLQAFATRQDKPMNAATGNGQYTGSSRVRLRSRTTVRRAKRGKADSVNSPRALPFSGLARFTGISRAAPLVSW
jgi:hypothetical protein